MMYFDEHGYLYPHDMIELTLSDFESFFVENLADFAHRKDLFERYVSFVDELKTSFPISFFQFYDRDQPQQNFRDCRRNERH